MKSAIRLMPTALAGVVLVNAATMAQSFYLRFEPPPATQPADAQGESEEVKLSVGRADEYDAVVADLGISGDQLAAFQARNLERIENLKTFVASDDGAQLIALREQLAAARREKRTAEITPLRAQIKPLSDKYWAIRNQARRDLLSILTQAQVKRYAGFTLLTRTLRGMEQLELTAEQKTNARAITDEAAEEWFKPEMMQADPYFRELLSIEAPTRRRIIAQVLTDDQRALLKSPSTRATRRPAQ